MASHPYTVIFLTPSRGTPTFLHDLQQHPTLRPIFIGQSASFFRKANPTNWPWSHILLFEGLDAQLPTDWSIRQQWRFTFSSETPFAPLEENYWSTKDTTDFDDALKNEMIAGFAWYPQEGKGAVVLSFGNQGSPENIQENDVNSHVYVAGPVTESGKMVQGSQSWDGEAFNQFALQSFPSKKDLGVYLAKGGESGGNTGIVFSQEWKMPSEKIDPYAWTYGNPYEPYGEDWFG
ncbi:hypothetical protein N0V90_012383 [Kalmusia sp. IMI 367209]|nr:hypothetical protein N0V90_012383 [Kalmusia sp. IMI 367209]